VAGRVGAVDVRAQVRREDDPAVGLLRPRGQKRQIEIGVAVAGPIQVEAYADRETFAAGAAQLLAGRLALPGSRTLAATGGSTPGPIYDRLAAVDIKWNRVIVTLTDDRWVDAASPDSNEAFVRTRLLRGPAAVASFVPLRRGGPTADADAEAAEPGVSAMLPFAAVLLGMGEDGHIASLFPRVEVRALDPNGPRTVIGVAMAGLAPFVPRVSLTARALLSAELVVLAITGAAKRAIVERILSDPAFDLPAAAVLRQDRTPVRILWAP
jgi:6-phosphogluconolactonase